MNAPYAVGIDLGGTFIKAGVVDAANKIVHRQSIETLADRGVDDTIDRLGRLVTSLLAATRLSNDHVAGVGIGAPGPMSHAAGMILSAPNLPGWTNVPLRKRLNAVTGLRTTLENDANAAAFGELTAGAGQAVRDLVFFTLGTGVGGGVIIDGRLHRGRFDNAGEFGHIIVQPDGRPCPCGQSGCLERYASALAVGQRATEAIRSGENSSLKTLLDQGKVIDAPDVDQAAVAGDPLARRIWNETCRFLAIACVGLQHVLNPERIVLGGGLIGSRARLLEPVRRHFRELTWNAADDVPEITLATLGNDAGIIGTAALARAEFAP